MVSWSGSKLTSEKNLSQNAEMASVTEIFSSSEVQPLNWFVIYSCIGFRFWILIS